MVSTGDQRLLRVLSPDSGGPIPDRQEVLGGKGVPVEAIHRTMVPREGPRDAVDWIFRLPVAC